MSFLPEIDQRSLSNRPTLYEVDDAVPVCYAGGADKI